MKNKKHLILIVTVIIFSLALFCVVLTSCSNNGQGEEHVHSFGEWQILRTPDCTHSGSNVRYCECGEFETREIDPLGHLEITDRAVEETCTRTGLTEGKHCSRCNQVFVPQHVIEHLGHSPVVDVAKEPDCVHTGLTEGLHCARCGEELVPQHIIDALGHNLDENGYCTVCGESRPGFTFELLDDGNSYKLVSYTGPLAELTIPSKYLNLPVKVIGTSAFRMTRGITSMVIPNSVTTLEDMAFTGCTQLETIVFGKNVTIVGQRVLMQCTALKSLTVLDGNEKYYSVDNCIIERETKTLVCGCKTSVIPVDGSVLAIAPQAFYQAIGRETVALPEGVTSIGNEAFYFCSDLKSVVLPHSLQSIGQWGFFYCSSLVDIFFDGTMAEWNSIQKGAVWDMGTGAYTVHCKDGLVAKPTDGGSVGGGGASR